MMDIVEYYSKATIEIWAQLDDMESCPVSPKQRAILRRFWESKAAYCMAQLRYWEKRT